jgi:Domain of unknown function (DUF4169)
MTSNIVNLNKARKARDRADDKKRAEENRVRFGRTKAEKETAARNEDARNRELDGTQLTPRLDDNHDDLDPGNVS